MNEENEQQRTGVSVTPVTPAVIPADREPFEFENEDEDGFGLDVGAFGEGGFEMGQEGADVHKP